MQNIDWANLTFGYYPTNYNVRCYFRNGQWGELEISSDTSINIHMAATCLHYGQEAFEGMKAFRGKDGKVRVFRWDENCKRLQRSAQGIMMAEFPDDKFWAAIEKVVRLNADFIPPTPVGPYFKGGFMANPYVITRKYDRAAPLGTGTFKVGGNYAASLRPHVEACHGGQYACEFYLDAKEKKYIDEAGAANFFGIKDNTYITPQSTSILPSITNKSLMQLAETIGLKVERRPIAEEELSTFEEAGACGTAAVISPISRIDDPENGKSYTFGDGKPGPWSEKLYNKLRGIQYGTEPDEFGWTTVIEGL